MFSYLQNKDSIAFKAHFSELLNKASMPFLRLRSTASLFWVASNIAKYWTELKNSYLEVSLLRVCVCVLVNQSCPTLCDPMDCSLPGSSDHGISQARITEWVAIPFSRGSSWRRDQTRVSCTAGRFFTIWVTRKTPVFSLLMFKKGGIFSHYLCCRFLHKYWDSQTNNAKPRKIWKKQWRST